MMIELPFPPSSLSGHNNGNWRGKSGTVRKYREWAKAATQEVFGTSGWPDRGTGDIAITVRFIPPDRRGDRMNYPNRIKPAIDGIADALKVNDKRFDPCFIYCAPEKPGRVEVFIHTNARMPLQDAGIGESAGVQKKTARTGSYDPRPSLNINAKQERDV
jgi:crossover junction endodeoxyribonuclease RusA